jgi:hypothetical protein
VAWWETGWWVEGGTIVSQGFGSSEPGATCNRIGNEEMERIFGEFSRGVDGLVDWRAVLNL